MTEPLLTLRVARKQAATERICTLELEALPGQTLPPFTPGAHLELQLGEGLVRQYSLVNAPSERGLYRLGVLLDPQSRGGSRAVHEQVQAGQTLQVRGPRNHFALDPSARHHLLLAGGIGITPLLSMAQHLADPTQRAGGTRFSLHYAARSRAQAAYLERLAEPDLAARVQHHFDDGPPEQRLDLNALLARPDPGTHVYVCGPQGFIEATLAAARNAGWPEAQLHYEYFGATVQAQAGDRGFEIELARSGKTVWVAPDCSAADALTAAGVSLMTACLQGVCGTCLTPVLSGQPEHRDAYLSAEERASNQQFLPCCSRAVSERLVLDL